MRVAVLGAGVIGVTSAWYLAKAGHEVTVIDRQPSAGMETSFANGGQISAWHAEPWASPSVIPKMVRWLGREDAPLLFRPQADPAQWEWGLRFLRECLPGRFERNREQLAGLARYSLQCLSELRAAAKIECHQLERGILIVYTEPGEFAAISQGGGLAEGLELKTSAQCLEIEPALAESSLPICGGVFAPRDQSGDAHEFTARLAQTAARAGVVFRFATGILRLNAPSERVEYVQTASGEVRADAFVVALGSFSTGLLKMAGIRVPVYPLKGYSITLTLEQAEQRFAPIVSITDEAAKIVVSRFGDRLRAAGTAELAGYDMSINDARCEAIHARLASLFPGLKAVTAIQKWAGLRPATPTNVPIIGRTRLKNLFLNTGHGTLGWTLACGSAHALADLVSGRRPDVDFGFL